MSKPHEIDEIVMGLVYHYLGPEDAVDYLRIVLGEIQFVLYRDRTKRNYWFPKSGIASLTEILIFRFIMPRSIYCDYAKEGIISLTNSFISSRS